MSKSPEAMAATMIANLKEKTGKSLEQWLDVSRTMLPAKHREIVSALKADHGMTHGFANLVATKTLEPGKPAAGDALVQAQYAGPKAALRPIYDALISAVTRFGEDVEVSPKKSYVSLRRNKQFGVIQPSTRSRVDVGLNLVGVPPEGRLESSGSFNAMVSHRVRIEAASEVDRELVGWLKKAYEGS